MQGSIPLRVALVKFCALPWVATTLTAVAANTARAASAPAGPAYASQRLCFGNFAARYSI